MSDNIGSVIAVLEHRPAREGSSSTPFERGASAALDPVIDPLLLPARRAMSRMHIASKFKAIRLTSGPR